MVIVLKKTNIVVLHVFAVLLLWNELQCEVNAQGGLWEVVVGNAGISSMHTTVTHFGNVVLLDRTNIGNSSLSLPAGVCRHNPADRASTNDCTAHSAVYSPDFNTIRPLFIFTDTWCSSGQFDAFGTLVQTGGDADGVYKIRTFAPCDSAGDCNWVETETELTAGRWYASNQRLPDGSQIVVGGRGAPTIEYVPAKGLGAVNLDLLNKSEDAQTDNLYPFVHLLPNNNLFIFANRDSILYNWQNNTVVRQYPTIPDGPRNYPSGGSSVMLPLTAADGFQGCEVLICGGAAYGAFLADNIAATATQSCGRMNPLAKSPKWAMENMPQGRIMGDMVVLPTGDVLIINGARMGAQGWGFASSPIRTPVQYYPAERRFESLFASPIPRMYHSTANLLPDGRILVAGSNTHQFYTFDSVFPTELRMEAFSPPYLLSGGARPSLADVPQSLGYGKAFTATVDYAGALINGTIQIKMASAPYVTHSYAQGQRLLQLGVAAAVDAGVGKYTVASTSPPSTTIAPAGYYMMFAVANGVPSSAKWVKMG